VDKPIREPKDIVGVKLRVPEVPIYLANMKALGANAIGMNWGEVFTSMQTGVIDGQENPLDNIYANKFYEISKYVSLSAHVIQNQVILINEKKFQKMPPELQEIVVQAAVDAGDWQTQQATETFDHYKQALIEKGMTVIEDVDRDAFRDKCKGPLLEEWESVWGKGLYEEIEALAQ
jgi:TRAP-type C4-dicarboxylate transport system substrate-binding protein